MELRSYRRIDPAVFFPLPSRLDLDRSEDLDHGLLVGRTAWRNFHKFSLIQNISVACYVLWLYRGVVMGSELVLAIQFEVEAVGLSMVETLSP